MLFNSVEFALFLPLVFGVYWMLNGKLRIQNAWIVLSSYVFYGWWSWEFLGLIALSTAVDFLVGLRLDPNREAGPNKKKSQLQRKAWLGLSIAVNLGLLGYFKYAGFFVQNWIDAWASLGIEMHASTLKIILPVGISFYTFQTLSYSIDVYREKLKPSRDIVAFAGFVAFFPQLVAGPIERATRLLPQLSSPRKFNYSQARDGLVLILWGLFKKVVIAETCAGYVDMCFTNPGDHSGSTLVMGVVFFAFQIYGDFSGYSDIAIGTSKLLGIELMSNFKTPYFSRDIGEFWRRWHISLSTWFRDYVYIPLGGSRVGQAKAIRNVFAIFLVSGFWHGANWTFVAWGGIHAVLFVPLLLRGKNRQHASNVVAEGRLLPSLKDVYAMGTTFAMVCAAWIFFRADSIDGAVFYFEQIGPDLFTRPWISRPTFLFCGLLILHDWFHRHDERRPLQIPFRPARWLAYCMIAWLVLKGLGTPSDFIYFQF
jgi:alginate O-acetyltransferase complex protein AlgI